MAKADARLITTLPSSLPPDALLTALNGALVDLDHLDHQLCSPAWRRAAERVEALTNCLPTIAPATLSEALAMLAGSFLQVGAREGCPPSAEDDRRMVQLCSYTMEAALPVLVAVAGPRGIAAQHTAIVGHALRLGRGGDL